MTFLPGRRTDLSIFRGLLFLSLGVRDAQEQGSHDSTALGDASRPPLPGVRGELGDGRPSPASDDGGLEGLVQRTLACTIVGFGFAHLLFQGQWIDGF